jgi:L-threonylcarbamoyladenylate synthase
VTTRSHRIVAARDPAAIESAVAAAAVAIAAGKLVGVPTETVYGVACALTDEAIEHLLRTKGRPPQKGITVLVDSLDQAAALADVPVAARRLADRFWPGPLTLVLRARAEAGLPMLLTGPRFTIGLRLPDHEVPRALARALGPLPLTSANRSGEPDATDAEGVVDALGDAVEVVIDAGPSSGGVPSTVVAIEETEPEREGGETELEGTTAQGEAAGGESVRVLREGALSTESILSALR